ncbi:MAG: helix-turn-helix transcriptional regulator [Ruminococcus sp.]|nr:helix-turn-helix transcriptional regulator [Ruminococcus sp.]
MNQIKIGNFISSTRKQQGLTQRQLADKLLISDKTVSKWECGKGMPEVSLMLPLCDALGINLNELFSGEKLTDADYKKKAEENIMNLVKEKSESKKKIILSVIVMVITFMAGVVLIMTSGLLEMPLWFRIHLIVTGAIAIIGGILVATMLDMDAGTFECKYCGMRFKPTAGEYIKGLHTITKRKLKCPHCGKTSYCKRRLTH